MFNNLMQYNAKHLVRLSDYVELQYESNITLTIAFYILLNLNRMPDFKIYTNDFELEQPDSIKAEVCNLLLYLCTKNLENIAEKEIAMLFICIHKHSQQSVIRF